MDIPTFHPGRQGRDVPQLVVSVGGRAGLRSARQCWYHQLWIFFIGILIRMAFFSTLGNIVILIWMVVLIYFTLW